MSELFYVSTDYLLKQDDDDIDVVDTRPVVIAAEKIDSGSQQEVKQISMEFASEFIDTTKKISKKFGAAVMACVFSPIVLLVLAAYSENPSYNVSEAFAVGVGMVVLFVLVAAAVMVFILDGMKLSKYEFLEKDPIKLMYGVEAVITRYKEMYEPTFRISIATGVLLCIMSAVPIVVAGACEASEIVEIWMVAILMLMVGIAVFLFVSSGMVYGSFQKLLQLDDYDPEEKRNKKKYDKVYGAYWCVVTAGYLAWSFVTLRWDFTWLVWPVAGVLFVPFKLIIESVGKKQEA